MKHTNINITSPYGLMNYFFEYSGNTQIVSKNKFGYKSYENISRLDIYADPSTTELRRQDNEWYVVTPEEFDYVCASFTQRETARGIILGSDEYVHATPLAGVFATNVVPNLSIEDSDENNAQYHTATLNIYFPAFSVDTYKSGVKYAVDVCTWINGVQVVLCSCLIDRNDVLAADRIKIFNNQEYYEFTSIEIIDPWFLMYDKSWGSFREMVCGAPSHNYNSIGSLLNISLHPVIETTPGVYIEVDDFHGGQNSINISDVAQDYISFNISDNRNENSYYESRLIINTNVVFNTWNEDEDIDIREYIKRTYNINDDFDMCIETVVQDKDNIYRYAVTPIDNPYQEIDVRDIIDANGMRILQFDNWNQYKDGMFLKMFLHIVPTDPSIHKPRPISQRDSEWMYQLPTQVYIPRTPGNVGYIDPIQSQVDFERDPHYNVTNVIKLNHRDSIKIITDDISVKILKSLNIYDGCMASVVQIPITNDSKIFEYTNDNGRDEYLIICTDDAAFNGYYELHRYLNSEIKLEDSILYIPSNRILITQDLFRYLINDGAETNKIYLEAVDMNVFNINAVNKVEQTVVQMNRPDDYKANIIKPVFFRVHELGNIIIHPDITEQICLNLDSYKSKVNSFILKIEGITFVEVGRTNAGIIFKIVGSSLPGKISNGTFYVLNEKGDLVTTGSYKYER